MDTPNSIDGKPDSSANQGNEFSLNIFVVIDCSSSMVADGKLECLNQIMMDSITNFQAFELENNIKVHLNVIKFSTSADWHILNPASIGDIQWKMIESHGITNTGAALNLLAQYLEENPQKFCTKNRPAIILITDGIPTDDYQSGLRALLNTKWGLKSIRYAISLGEDVEASSLRDFVRRSKGDFIQVDGCKSLGSSLFKIFNTEKKTVLKRIQRSKKQVLMEASQSPAERKPVKERLASKSVSPDKQEEKIEIMKEDSLLLSCLLRNNSIEYQTNETSKSGYVNTQQKTPLSLIPERGFTDWLEQLPYPLASILWRYYAEIDDRSKIENLLHFFEATAQFVCMIFLSAFHSDKQYFLENRELWFGDESSLNNNPIRRSSFGSWVVVGERLAKSTRRLLSDPTNRSRCFQLFGTARVDILEAITIKDLFSILKTVNDYRNNWQGHGGVASEEECSIRREKLELELLKLQKVFSNKFHDFVLLRPISAEFEGEIFYNTVVNLMGTRSYFRKVVVQTKVPLDKRNLFIKETDSSLPLRLIPLVKMESTPRKEHSACYFYNRVDTKGMRWVSYHFDEVSEIILEDQELLSFFAELEGRSADSTRVQ